MRSAASANAGDRVNEPTLGGKLLYTGELDSHGCAAVVAGNVAGCATLAGTADPAAQKLAIREGIVDFVVTSLDEALRILKNEVRKRATVAVSVGSDPSAIEREMIERGVLPDLVFDGRAARDFGPGSRKVALDASDADLAFVTWQVAQSPARWLPRLDEIAQDCLSSDSWMQRWLRLSPRYSGRSAQAHRAVNCDLDSAGQMVKRFGNAVQDGVIDTQVSVSVVVDGETKEYRLSPSGTA
jgi:urocanate hydratase